MQKEAVYGLTELAREHIAGARLVACPGCYPTAALLPLVPIVLAGLIDAGDIVIDAKSGVSGAGRAVKEGSLFAEVAEGVHAYGVASHRHAPEIEQLVSGAAGHRVTLNFTPHLMPMNRGILSTIYVRLAGMATADDLRATLAKRYAGEPFVARAGGGHGAGHPPRARIQPLPDRRLRRPRARPRHHPVGDRQPGEGSVRAGDPEHEPALRPRRDERTRSPARCSHNPFPIMAGLGLVADGECFPMRFVRLTPNPLSVTAGLGVARPSTRVRRTRPLTRHVRR